MKKLTLIIALIFTLLLSGCSCGGKTELKFESKWGGNTVGYTEQLTYEVNYSDDYTFGGVDFTKTNTLPTLNITAIGSYVIKNEVLSLSSNALPEEVKTSSLVLSMPYVIKSTSLLTLVINYTLEGTEYSSVDMLSTETYFCPPEGSLSPVLTKESYAYSLPKISDTFVLDRVVGQNQVTYGQEKYKTVQIVMDESTGEEKGRTEKSFSFEPKTVIDNSSFLFSMRNLDYKTIAEYVIPVVHPTYGKSQDLRVSKFENSDIKLDLNVNGETLNQLTIPTNAIKYAIASENKSGANQLLFVQNSAVNGLADKALIVRYVSPFSDYDGFRKLGALIYTLESVTYFA